MSDVSIWISAGAFIVAAFSLLRGEQVRRAVRHARPNARLRDPVILMRDAFEAVVAGPSAWRHRKVSVGNARKSIESNLAAVVDGELKAKLEELCTCVQQAFEVSASRPRPGTVEHDHVAEALQEIARRGENAAKHALRRMAELESRV